MNHYPPRAGAPTGTETRASSVSQKWTIWSLFRKRWWLILALALSISVIWLQISEITTEARLNSAPSYSTRHFSYNPIAYVFVTTLLYVPVWVFLRLYMNTRIHHWVLGYAQPLLSYAQRVSNSAFGKWVVAAFRLLTKCMIVIGPWVLPSMALISTLYVLWRLFGIGDVVEAMLGVYSVTEFDTFSVIFLPDFLLIFAAIVAVITSLISRKVVLPMYGLMKSLMIVSIIAAILSFTRIGLIFGVMSMAIAEGIMQDLHGISLTVEDSFNF